MKDEPTPPGTQHTNLAEIPWSEQCSPRGRFHIFRRHISHALGAPRDAGVAGGGHPFDVEQSRLPPGATNFPFHAHAAQWELFLILSGRGELRTGGKMLVIGAGDTFVCPPGEPHQLTNTGSEDLLYYVIADNPPVDMIHYPDSDKLLVKPQRRCFTAQDADYYTGEE